ncbi:hypothetical protein Trydic_g23377 [Trypoxylus dichotomus]
MGGKIDHKLGFKGYDTLFTAHQELIASFAHDSTTIIKSVGKFTDIPFHCGKRFYPFEVKIKEGVSQGAGFAKTWSRTNAHQVDHLHAKQHNSSCIHEHLQHSGDGSSAARLCSGACWWMISYPIFGGRASTRRVTPMILPSQSAGDLRAWYPKGCKSHSGS